MNLPEGCELTPDQYRTLAWLNSQRPAPATITLLTDQRITSDLNTLVDCGYVARHVINEVRARVECTDAGRAAIRSGLRAAVGPPEWRWRQR